METLQAIGEIVLKLVENPLGLTLLIVLCGVVGLVIKQRRELDQVRGQTEIDLAKVQGETKIDESDRAITLELIRANDKFYTKIDTLTEALTTASTEQARANTLTKDALDQESRRIAMREAAIENEHADRQRMFDSQDHMAREMNASVQAINSLATSLTQNIQRTLDDGLAKSATNTAEQVSLSFRAGLNESLTTLRTEIKSMNDQLLQQILDELKQVKSTITIIADKQTTDSADLRQVSERVGDIAKRLQAVQDDNLPQSPNAAPNS